MAREGQTSTPSGDLDVFGKELPLTCECGASPRVCACVSVGCGWLVGTAAARAPREREREREREKEKEGMQSQLGFLQLS